ncbi:iron-containing alcohol dehydrogenase [Pseudarthrobacter oxydans]|uniref:iron-containing alcohol dehydrogenase n=1 Tax=Pseudarthrobacter oxydans TaxID=1671 RepID=UPI002AA8E2AD|nr:iron-containing alcohol dehydrogenase [Pseudarthrobacter oxydans]WPU11055.1 iron-containing alcohol dehydrogenase [Pseudarthrobacter oxydans]
MPDQSRVLTCITLCDYVLPIVSNLKVTKMSKHWWPGTDSASAFLAPAVVIGGRGSLSKIASVLQSHLKITSGSVLVAVDDAVLNTGLADELIRDLEDTGYEVTVASGFGSEPSSEIVDAAAEMARNANARVVIGLGGGSVLDSSKIISLLLCNEGKSADWLGVVEPPNGVAPLVLIPTTCGTGAEATRVAMVTVAGSKRVSSCALYVPSVALIDPNLVASLPTSVIAATGMDALAHAVESLMATTASVLSAHHALRAIELLAGNLENAFNGDQEALANCLWGSHLAGQALNAGVVVGHSLAYCLAHERPMPHGMSCALALPYCIAYNRTMDPGLASTLASVITRGNSSELSDAARWIQDLTKRLGLPTTLDEAMIATGTETAMAARCVAEYPRPTNPVPLDETKLAELLIAMRTGDLPAAFGFVASTAHSNQ